MNRFDEIINRKGTGSLKWDRYLEKDIIPMWVADMDFQAPRPVLDALHGAIEHGIFGYPVPTAELTEVICVMLKRKYDWTIDPKWLVWLPGLVTGLNIACRSVGRDGDEVMTLVPIYPPFLSAPRLSGRELVTIAFNDDSRRWSFDINELEKARTKRTKLLLFCNPHNPTGRVFTREELESVADFCLHHDIIICSDEVHCDLILDDRHHLPTATLKPELQERTITLMAPSKTFNLPGLGCSFAIIPNSLIRGKFKAAMQGIVPDVNLFGYTACLAAYRDCSDWLKDLLKYLRGNRDWIFETVNAELRGLSVKPIEATYLAWIDVRETGVSQPAAFFERYGVGLSDGVHFGSKGFVRLNYGCPRVLLEAGLARMKKALDEFYLSRNVRSRAQT